MFTRTVDVHEAQKRFTELLSWVTTGTEVILTEGSQHIARLVPVTDSISPRLPGLHEGAIWMREDFDSPMNGEAIL